MKILIILVALVAQSSLFAQTVSVSRYNFAEREIKKIDYIPPASKILINDLPEDGELIGTKEFDLSEIINPFLIFRYKYESGQENLDPAQLKNVPTFNTIGIPEAITGFGNSGSGIFCTGANSSPRSGKLLDLLEYNRLNPGAVVYSDAAMEIQLEAALKKLHLANYYLERLVNKSFALILANLRIKADGKPLDPIGDVGALSFDLAPNCQQELIAMVSVDTNLSGVARGFLVVDIRNYLALESNTDRAALWLHEALYLTLRLQNPGVELKSSALIRNIVGEVFSSKTDERHLRDLIDKFFE